MAAALRAAGLRTTAVAVGVGAALLVSEVVIRLLYPDRWLHGTLLEHSQFEESDVPGVAFVYRPNLPGLTNELGLISTRPVERPKPAGRLRILVVGDSVSSIVMNEPSTAARGYPAIMERELRARSGRDLEVLNLSTPGLSLAQELRLLAAKGLPLEPDIILIGYCFNDPIETDVLRSPNIVVEFPAVLSLLRLKRYASLQSSPRAWYEEGGEVSARLERSFAALGELARSRRLAVVPLPVLDDVPAAQLHLPIVARLAAANQLPVVDIATSLQGRLETFRSSDRHDRLHMNAEGHEAVGRVLADRLEAVVRAQIVWPP